MILVGLTGGIGSGKSTVAERLVVRGAVLVDADALARRVVEPGREAFEQIVERFGPGVVASDGALDRAAIAEIVFRDKQALADLNAIVHPAVGVEVMQRIAAEAGTDHAVILDIPLLVEGKARERYALAGVLVVDTPLDIALERLVEQRGMDREDAQMRIANQATREQRMADADFVIINMGTLAELDEMVDRAWEWIERLVEAAKTRDG